MAAFESDPSATQTGAMPMLESTHNEREARLLAEINRLRAEVADHIRRSDNMEAELEGLRRELNQAINDADRAIEHARRVDGKERERLRAEVKAMAALLYEACKFIDRTRDPPYPAGANLADRIETALKAQEGKA